MAGRMARKLLILLCLAVAVYGFEEDTWEVTDKPSEAPDLSTPSVSPSENSTGNTSLAPPGPTSPKPTDSQPDPCVSHPCGSGSTCEPRNNNTHICLCLPGQVYGAGICNPAKVFPGNLDTAFTYDDKMKNTQSKEFQEVAQKITDLLVEALKGDDYITSIVLKIMPTPKDKYWSLRKDELVSASVENIYILQSGIKEDTITENINKVTGITFSASDLCKSNACDSDTTTCAPSPGDFNCTCKTGYVESNYSPRICTACPSGTEATDDKINPCAPCPFGYSGFNCDESWKLVLVIVGSVLGGLLLITLITLPLVMRKSSKSSKKSSKKSPELDIGNAYISHSPAKSPLVNRESANQPPAYANAGVPRIPRATTNSWDRGTNLEMTPSNSRQNLVPAGRSMTYEDRDVRNGNLNAPNRGQTNPYGQNPYAQSRGVTNSYYQHDDGRRLY